MKQIDYYPSLPTKTTEDIFAALEGAYFNEKQKAVEFLSLKQNVGERVRIYYQRVRGQIAQLNMKDSAASRIQADALTLKFFVSGVLPYIAAQFKILRPTELNDAVIKAEQCENEYILENPKTKHENKNFENNYKPYINTQASRPTTSYQNGPSRQSSLAVVGACFHCGRKGHSFRFCRNISSTQLADLTKKQPQLIINEINRLNSVAESQPSHQTSA